jgi:pSer/pThr/pTyr-binding forkhead associated (FHA) protein
LTDLRLEPMHVAGAPLEPRGDRATVGRVPPADLVIAEASVSRLHAVLRRQDSRWQVIDQGSVNGTFLDGRRITSAELRAGQELRFGSRSFRVCLEATAPAPAPPRPARARSPRPDTLAPYWWGWLKGRPRT